MNNPKTLTIIILAIIVFSLKSVIFPNPLEKASAHFATISKLASFQNKLPPLSVVSRLKSLQNEIDPNIQIDLNDFTKNTETPKYSLKEVQDMAPLYFQQINKIDILTRDIKRVSDSDYQLTVIARGNTIEKSFDDAYSILVSFNKDWKILKIKVLAPPSN